MLRILPRFFVDENPFPSVCNVISDLFPERVRGRKWAPEWIFSSFLFPLQTFRCDSFFLSCRGYVNLFRSPGLVICNNTDDGVLVPLDSGYDSFSKDCSLNFTLRARKDIAISDGQQNRWNVPDNRSGEQNKFSKLSAVSLTCLTRLDSTASSSLSSLNERRERGDKIGRQNGFLSVSSTTQSFSSL